MRQEEIAWQWKYSLGVTLYELGKFCSQDYLVFYKILLFQAEFKFSEVLSPSGFLEK